MALENILRGSGDIGAMLCTCWGLSQLDPVTNRVFVQNCKARDFAACEPFIIQGRPSIDETGYFELTDPPGFAGNYADAKNNNDGPPAYARQRRKTRRRACACKLPVKVIGKSPEELGISIGTVEAS